MLVPVVLLAALSATAPKVAADDPANAGPPAASERDDAQGAEEDAADADEGRPPASERPRLLHGGEADAPPSAPEPTVDDEDESRDLSELVGPGAVTWLAGLVTAIAGWAVGAAVMAVAAAVGSALFFSPVGPCLVFCGMMTALGVGGVAPAGQGVLAATGWESMTDDEVSLIIPIAAAYASCGALTVAGLVVTLALLGLGALLVSVVGGPRRIPNPNAVAAATAALPITVGAVVVLLQPSIVVGAVAWEALRPDDVAPRADELLVGSPSSRGMRF